MKTIIVPTFKTYFPSQSELNKEQKIFYSYLVTQLRNGCYVDIDGNISYVFLYLYSLLEQWQKYGLKGLSDYLTYMSELYIQEQKIWSCCTYWACDCLLGLKQYEQYLLKTEPSRCYGSDTHRSNLRLNIQRKLGIEANPIDILLISSGRKSKLIVEYHAQYKDKIRDIFLSHAEKSGGWFNLLDTWSYPRTPYPHTLFHGAAISKIYQLEFKIFAYYSAKELDKNVRELTRKAENSCRVELGLPMIGEGWISETQLFKSLEKEFANTVVIQHGQPEWLGRQHYDVWFPNWKIAVEYHGEQHFSPVDFFGGNESFQKTLIRDKKKTNISKRNGVKLIILREGYELDKVISEIKKIIQKRKVTSPDI